MTDTYTGEGNYVLNRLKLFIKPDSTEEEVELDLYEAMIEMSLFESMYDVCMSGYISVTDSLGLNDLIPFYGNERIEIEFHTAGAEQNPIVYTGYVYKITERVRISDHSMGYKIMFTSKAVINNLRKPVQRGYRDSIDRIVQSIYRTHLKDDEFYKPLDTTSTYGIQHYTFGEVSPFKAIDIMTRNAVSTQQDVGYFFFETNQRFVFSPIQGLYKKEPVAQYITGPGGVYIDLKNRFSEQFESLQSIDMREENSFMDRIMDGMHGSQHSFLDLQTLNMTNLDYTRESRFDPQRSLGSIPDLAPIESGQDVKFMTYNDITRDRTDLSRVYMLNRMKKREAETFKAEVVVFGDSLLQVGDTKEVQFPTLTQGEQRKSRFSGKVIITEIRHTLTKNQYMQSLMLQKDAYEEAVE